MKASMLDISGHFVGQRTRLVPVGDSLEQKVVLFFECFFSKEIRGAYQAWNVIDGALQSEMDRSILKRCKSPREVFDHLEKWYDPESEIATQKLCDKFHDHTIPLNSNPIETLHALEGTNNQMAEKGMGIPDTTFMHTRFVRTLPDEYGHVKATLQATKNRDRAEIIRMVGTRYSTLLQKKWLQRSSRPPEQVFCSNKSSSRSGTRRDCGRRRGGTKNRGRGGSSSKAGGSSSGGGSSSVSSARGSSHGGGSRPHGRCWRCNKRGHIKEECPTKFSDFLTKCARCPGFGHEESTCSSEAAVLAMEMPVSEENFAVEAQGFVAKESSKCNVVVGEEVAGGELGK